MAVFDLGGTWFRWGYYLPAHGLSKYWRVPAISYLSQPHSSAAELQEAMVEFITARMQELCAAHPRQVKRVSVSVGAPVNARNGIVLGSGPLWGPAAGPFPLQERLQRALPPFSWYVFNDITALLAPYMRTDSVYAKTMLITVSSGIGSRLFDHRRGSIPFDGEHGVQGEIGHLVCTFELSGRRLDRYCECGGRNHINAFASGRGIAATLKSIAALEAGCARISPDAWLEADDGYRCKAWQAALAEGNESAETLLDAFVQPLARILAAALTLDPQIERIVMTGGVVHGLGKCYRDALQRVFRHEELYQITARDPDYLNRRLYWEEPDDFSGLRGAGLYAARLCHQEDRHGLAN